MSCGVGGGACSTCRCRIHSRTCSLVGCWTAVAMMRLLRELQLVQHLKRPSRALRLKSCQIPQFPNCLAALPHNASAALLRLSLRLGAICSMAGFFVVAGADLRLFGRPRKFPNSFLSSLRCASACTFTTHRHRESPKGRRHRLTRPAVPTSLVRRELRCLCVVPALTWRRSGIAYAVGWCNDIDFWPSSSLISRIVQPVNSCARMMYCAPNGRRP